MLKYIALLFFTPFLAHSSEVKDIKVKKYKNHPITIYLTIENTSQNLDYLLGIDVLSKTDAKAKIYKSVIEQGIVRIIKIDRLAIPSKSKVNLEPMGIFIMLEANEYNNLKLKFKFNSKEVIIDFF